MDCAGCGATISNDSRFCPQCGAPQKSRCPACGHANVPGARFCSQCGARLAGAVEEQPAAARVAAAERRQITVMFCDLVGSTALATRLDPEDLREVIGAYHRCAAETVARFHGFVAQYLGDGVLVYFGYPEAREDDAEQAVRGALALTAAVPALKPRSGATLDVRIGIATGLVVIGDLTGTGASVEHKIVGETPNLAARLQALAAPNEVVIAESTRRLLGALFEVEDMGAVALKGFAAPAQVFRVRGEGVLDSRFEALRAAALTPLIGREEELELLLRRWQLARRGEGRVVLLSGEPGIGKSRLVTALQERLKAEPHTRLRYFCSPHHQDSALYPTIAQLERAAGFERGDTPDARFEKLETLLAPGSASAEDVALFAELLSLPLPSRYPPLTLSPSQRKARTFEALIRQLDFLASAKPLVMVFEDVHWLDPTSRELLDLVIDRVRGLPVLLLVTFRPEFQPPWTGQSHVTAMVLNRLGRGDGAALVAGIAAANALPKEVVDEIVARTDGVPLFVEEMTKAVVEAGASVSHMPLSGRAVPATLHASLMARLDRLGPAAKDVAQIGAVIGREFSYEMLATVAPGGGNAIAAPLAQLVESGLVSQRGTPPDAIFLFKHVLVQDAAYGTLLRDRRRQLHSDVARAIEERFPDRAEIQPEVIAHHLTEADQTEPAIRAWLKAGRRSAERSAYREAIAQFDKGLALLGNLSTDEVRDRTELELQTAFGGAHLVVSGFAAQATADAAYRARDLCLSLGERTRLVPILWTIGAFHLNRGEFRTGQDAGRALVDEGTAQNNEVFQSAGHFEIGVNLLALGEFVAARTSFEKAISLYPSPSRTELRRFMLDPRNLAYATLPLDLVVLGFPRQAIETSLAAVQEAKNFAHPPTLANALSLAARTSRVLRDDAAFAAYSTTLIALAEEHGLQHFIALARFYRALVLADQRHVSEAVSEMQQGLEHYEATGATRESPLLLAWLADGRRKCGDIDLSIRTFDMALRAVEATEHSWFEAEIYRLKGLALLTLPDGNGDAAAETAFCAALTCGRNQNARWWELRAAVSLTRLMRDQGRRGEALGLLMPIYGWFTEGFDTPDLVDAKALLGELR